MPLPKTYQGLQRALGIFNYQREFIPNFAGIVSPLYRLLEIKNVPTNQRKKNGMALGKFILTWDEEALLRFEQLKMLTGEALEIFQPNFELPSYVYCDESEIAYGGHIFQKVDGRERALGYFSKTYSSAQKNYSTGEKELLAVVKTIQFFLNLFIWKSL